MCRRTKQITSSQKDPSNKRVFYPKEHEQEKLNRLQRVKFFLLPHGEKEAGMQRGRMSVIAGVLLAGLLGAS
jgi:hypothetical protein